MSETALADEPEIRRPIEFPILTEAENSDEKLKEMVADINAWRSGLEVMKTQGQYLLSPTLGNTEEVEVKAASEALIHDFGPTLVKMRNVGARMRAMMNLGIAEGEGGNTSLEDLRNMKKELMIWELLNSQNTPTGVEYNNLIKIEDVPMTSDSSEEAYMLRVQMRESLIKDSQLSGTSSLGNTTRAGVGQKVIDSYQEAREILIRAESETHDFQNPVTAMYGMLQLLEKMPSERVFLKAQSTINDSSRRALRRISFAYATASENLYPQENVEFTNLVNIINGQLSPILPLMGINAELPIDILPEITEKRGPTFIPWSTHWIERLAENVRSNAKKKFDSIDPETVVGGVKLGVQIDLSEDKRDLIIVFYDNMGGFPQEIRDAEEFTGLSEWSNDLIEGTGVGMKAQTQVIRQVYDGDIRVRESKDDQGNTVAQIRVRIPISR